MWPHEAVWQVLRKTFDWSGRARRSEYWWWALLMMIYWFLLVALPDKLGVFWPLGWFLPLTLVPTIGAVVRRLHDTGRSGWWWFLSLVPLGGIVLLVLLALPGEPWPNRYGLPPYQPRY